MLAEYKIETIVTLNYGGTIIRVLANIIFHNSSMKIADINIILLIIMGFDRNIKLLARFVVGSSSFCIFQVKNKVLC